MIPFLKKLFEPKSNGPEITRLLLQELNVLVTFSTLARELEEHPNYNSLLSISDVLSRYGVENLAARFNGDTLCTLPTPLITQMRFINKPFEYFTLIKKIEGDRILYYDPIFLKWVNITKEDFLKRYMGVALLVEKGKHTGEKDFAKKIKEEKRRRILSVLAVMALPLIFCLAGITAWVRNGTDAWPSLLYSLLCLAGATIGFLLLWYELDQHNPALQQICSSGKKTNCGAILQSAASKIAGISWSVVGFSYFMGSMLLLLFEGYNNLQILFILSWFNILALPYVFFSIYYQWRIARQWCILCLCVQALLLLQLGTILTANWTGILFTTSLKAESIPAIITAYGLPFILTATLIPVFKKAKDSKNNMARLQRLKHDQQIFDALLTKQKKISAPADDLGITLGNRSAAYKIIKVCNPYCTPCAKAHEPLKALLENNPNVQIQIIFTASNKEGNMAATTKHLLAIAEQHKNNEVVIKQGLNDWYHSPKKDYEQFAARYPMIDELKHQEHKIAAMRQWCDEAGISFTPTFFIKGYQLPALYSVEDLKYFLTV